MKRLPLVFNIAFAILALAAATASTFPWCDELVLTDAPANWAIRGISEGRVWPCTYNFLYPALLSIWFKVFGVSHGVTCSLTIFAALLAAFSCCHIGLRRKLFADPIAICAFTCMFWGGWGLLGIITNGRLDTLTMLFAILFADSLIPDGNRKEGAETLLMTSLWAVLLMLTSVYMLPVLFVLGLTTLFLSPADDRRVLIQKGIAAALAFLVAYLFMVGWHTLHREAIRFLGFYIYFNTITGLKADPLPSRIVRAYLFNPEALALSLMTFASALALRRRLTRPALAFVAFALATPLLMTLGGRYESYYSWAFYVPAAFILTALVCRTAHFRFCLLPVILLGAASFAANLTLRYTTTADARQRAEAAKRFVERHKHVFSGNKDVVVTEYVEGARLELYYPLLQCGARPWFRGEKSLTGPSDRDKFDVGLSMVIKDPARRKEMLEKALRFQKCMPTLPDSGYVVFLSEENRKDIEPLLRARGYEITPLSSDDYILAEIRHPR